MATVYPAARNLCAAATSRWCSEFLHAYNNKDMARALFGGTALGSFKGRQGRLWGWAAQGRKGLTGRQG
eukprot:scaffold8053_cov55-Phaeocystis_antarctica.AAC.2